MPLPGIANASLSMSQSQAQWDAIAAIKANSPFAAQADASTSSAAATLDAMLPGYGTMSTLGTADAADAAQGASTADETLAQVTERVRAAEQSTIDLFA